MTVAKLKKPPMAQWVEAAMLHAGMSQSDLARRLSERIGGEVDRSKVNKMVLGRRKVSADELFAIEEITGYPAPATLRAPQRSERLPAKLVQVPLLDTVTAGRLKAPSSQIPIEDVPLLAFTDLGRGEFFALRLEDDADSMDRVSPPGSIVIVNKADRQLRTGKFYIFSIDGETTYKMWQDGDPAYLSPYSTNPAHKPVFIRKKRDFDVIGRVKRTVLDL
ncbi:LexA family transcriptional regulator [Bradyrhizobium sp.]|uniref:LexA family transcriptional regulator n=1 Tax=Bradyrhizobium sp. TaxID=376 RepID=UPI003C4947A8